MRDQKNSAITVENPNVKSNEISNGKVREIIPKKLLNKWHRQYFLDTLIFNFLSKTKHSEDASKELSHSTYSNRFTRPNLNKIMMRLDQVGKKTGKGKIFDLPQVKNITSKEFYQEYIIPNRPVVLKGAAKDWACTQKWNLDFFKDNYGEHPIMANNGVQWSQRGTLAEVYKSFDTSKILKIADLIEDVKRGGSNYATFYPFLLHHPELREHINVEYLEKYFHMKKALPWQKKFYPKLFLGGKGTSTTIHCAGIINLNVQIYGNKRWNLWPPFQSPFLYPAHEISNNSGSNIDFRNPNYLNFPLFHYADQYQAQLEPGDIIFVPAWWWHGVENVTASISISNFILRVRSAMKGISFFALAIMDPWTVPALFLGNEDAAKEWEINLPKLVYQQRNQYLKQWASFFHFTYSTLAKKIRLLRKSSAPLKN